MNTLDAGIPNNALLRIIQKIKGVVEAHSSAEGLPKIDGWVIRFSNLSVCKGLRERSINYTETSVLRQD